MKSILSSCLVIRFWIVYPPERMSVGDMLLYCSRSIGLFEGSFIVTILCIVGYFYILMFISRFLYNIIKYKCPHKNFYITLFVGQKQRKQQY